MVLLYSLYYVLYSRFPPILWYSSLSNFVIPSKCLKNVICAASKRCSSLQTSLPNFNAALAVMLWILNFVSLFICFPKMYPYSYAYFVVVVLSSFRICSYWWTVQNCYEFEYIKSWHIFYPIKSVLFHTLSYLWNLYFCHQFLICNCHRFLIWVRSSHLSW
jgi:hypothetical protein